MIYPLSQIVTEL